MSAFFTLSGFLIAGVLFTRHQHWSRPDRLRAFWARRARRLLPAAWIAVAATLLLGAGGAFGSVGTGGDAVAALANVANWRLLESDVSYAASFDAPSPFQQFWSLAIEEQFYLVVPP